MQISLRINPQLFCLILSLSETNYIYKKISKKNSLSIAEKLFSEGIYLSKWSRRNQNKISLYNFLTNNYLQNTASTH